MNDNWIAIPGLIKNKRNEQLVKQIFNCDVEWYESDEYGLVLVAHAEYVNISPTLKYMKAKRFSEVKNEWIIV